jgi:hypothetical protein
VAGGVQLPSQAIATGLPASFPDQFLVGREQEDAMPLGQRDVTGIVSRDAVRCGDGQGVGGQVEGWGALQRQRGQGRVMHRDLGSRCTAPLHLLPEDVRGFDGEQVGDVEDGRRIRQASE